MKILHTVESYLPARHGMSEVVRQISEGLVRKGHEVWVATSRDPRRKTGQIRGVKIREFSVFGKSAFGIYGEAETYQRFLLESDAEVIVNFAAQQWATDLMLPLLGPSNPRDTLGLAVDTFGIDPTNHIHCKQYFWWAAGRQYLNVLDLRSQTFETLQGIKRSSWIIIHP